MRTLLETRIAGVWGERFLIAAINRGPSKPGMAMSVKTRSIPPCLNLSRASSPRVKLTTRYPRVSSMTLRWERDCSLSSTQRMVRFGFIFLSQSVESRANPKFNERFSLYEDFLSEMDANGQSSLL